jgi:hypothetical protein
MKAVISISGTQTEYQYQILNDFLICLTFAFRFNTLKSKHILRRIIMKELDTLIKTVADGLKSMAQGVEKLADKVEGISKSLSDEKVKGTPKTRSKRKAPAKPMKKKAQKSPKKTTAGVPKPKTAADTVLTAIKRSKKGVDTSALMKKTGYDRKKVANIIYKLKKQGEIKNAGKGLYLKA